MGQISVTIAGRPYRMACDDGQEEHLRALAARLDLKIAELRVHFGEIGDQRITVMAALTFLDQVSEAETKADALAAEIVGLRGSDAAAEAQVEAFTEAVATALGGMARRVERITRSLEPSQDGGLDWLTERS